MEEKRQAIIHETVMGLLQIGKKSVDCGEFIGIVYGAGLGNLDKIGHCNSVE